MQKIIFYHWKNSKIPKVSSSARWIRQRGLGAGWNRWAEIAMHKLSFGEACRTLEYYGLTLTDFFARKVRHDLTIFPKKPIAAWLWQDFERFWIWKVKQNVLEWLSLKSGNVASLTNQYFARSFQHTGQMQRTSYARGLSIRQMLNFNNSNSISLIENYFCGFFSGN